MQKMSGSQRESIAQFFVAINGNDAWSGSLPAPNSDRTDGPFRTLARARSAVRQTIAPIRGHSARDSGDMSTAKNSGRSIVVTVRGGTYFLREPFVLGPADGGTRECLVEYCAYPGEVPVISGGVELTDWEKHSGDILRCRIPDEVPVESVTLSRLRRLFFIGEPLPRARWPKHDPGNPIRGGWAFVEGPDGDDSHDSFVYRENTFRQRWAKPQHVEVNLYPFKGWCNCIVPVASIDNKKRVVKLAHNVWDVRTVAPWYWPMPISAGNRYCVENALEDLDCPGEWCVDPDDRTVYLWPPTDLGQEIEIVLPVLDCLLDIRGASHIRVSGFTFTGTATGDNMHRSGLAGYGAQLPTPGWDYVGEALHLCDAENITIEENHFFAVGGNAVYLEGHNARNKLRGNKVSYAGANGICLVGTRERHPVDNEVSDSEIHHCGTINKYVAGVFLGLSDGNLIRRNTIHHVPHHAINLGSNGYGRNILEYNDIRHACMEIFDTGAINSWGDVLDDSGTYVVRRAERAGHVIRFNHISDTWGVTQDEEGELTVGKNTRGIYLDDYTSNCFVYGNIIVGAVVGIQCHGGKNNLVENNFLIECTGCGLRVVDGCAFYPAAGEMRNFMRGNRFCRNIVYSRSAGTALFRIGVHADNPISYSDENVYSVPEGTCAVIDELADGQASPPFISLEAWQRLGMDGHTIEADPLFADPDQGDYRLLPGSPALALGIQQIDLRGPCAEAGE